MVIDMVDAKVMSLLSKVPLAAGWKT
jgi:hypothetical protein